MIVIPSIDLRGGNVVRLQQGDFGRQINYSVDPVETAKKFAAAGATWMHIVDLDGAKEGRPMQTELIGRIARGSGLLVEAGGGIRETGDIEAMMTAGVDRVVVGTAAMEKWGWFEKLAHEPGYAERLILALDARDGVVAVRGWMRSAERTAESVAAEVSGWPLAAILYTDVARDGMLGGPNLERTAALARAGRRPVIASGGVGSIEDVRALCKLPVWGAIVGRSLYEGKVDLGEAVKAANLGVRQGGESRK